MFQIVFQWIPYFLCDNKGGDDYFYMVSVHTGLRPSSGTKSSVCFIVAGDACDTGARILSDGTTKVWFVFLLDLYCVHYFKIELLLKLTCCTVTLVAVNIEMLVMYVDSCCFSDIFIWCGGTLMVIHIRGGFREEAQPAPPPPKIWKNKIVWLKIAIFHTKYPKTFRASLRWAQFF